MDTQICNRCQHPRDIEDFRLNPSGKTRRKICKYCIVQANTEWRKKHRKRHNERALKWYYDNPEKSRAINANNYRLQNKKRDRIQAMIFDDHHCLVCGEPRHGCLTFHHLNPKVKESGVTSHSLTWKKMLKEAAKCIVLCRNCHGLYHCGAIQLPKVQMPIDVSKYLKCI